MNLLIQATFKKIMCQAVKMLKTQVLLWHSLYLKAQTDINHNKQVIIDFYYDLGERKEGRDDFTKEKKYKKIFYG